MPQSVKTITDKLTEGRQYRDIRIADLETRAEQDGSMIVRGYATTFNQPYVLWSDGGYTVREQIDPAAFHECDMSDVIMQYNHEGRVFARTSNGTLKLWTDEKGLAFEARLDGTELGRQVYEDIDGGYTTKMSMGFIVMEDRRESTEDHDAGTVDVLRTITKMNKLYDVSAVSIPANDATSISARSYGEGVIAEIEEEIREREQRERQKQKIRIITEVNKNGT